MYSLYYYTETNMIAPTFLELKDGNLIKDFIGKKGYKAYTYRSNTPNTNIVINLTPEKSSQRIYVYTDKSKFSFDSEKNEALDYTWTNIRNMGSWTRFSNEIIISKDDPNYKDGDYYIFVCNRNSYYYNNFYSGTYYISITNEVSSIQINEGVSHSMYLSPIHLNQSYVYNHLNASENLYVNLNIKYGKADLVLDFDQKINNTQLDKAMYRRYDVVRIYIFKLGFIDSYFYSKRA